LEKKEKKNEKKIGKLKKKSNFRKKMKKIKKKRNACVGNSDSPTP